MGLDMNACYVRKMSDEDIAEYLKHKDEDGADFDKLIFTEGEYKESPDMYRDIMPYCRQIELVNDYIDLKKIRKDYDIPDDWKMEGESWSCEGVEFDFMKGKDIKHIQMRESDIDSRYTEHRKENCYIVCAEDLMYWRKNYALQEVLKKAYPKTIINCGWHKANKKMIQLMRAVGAYIPEECEGNIFYHEWY
ncbi:MAG: hypothetical protein ACI4CS_01285 [Candidatus Weimeria sp.]